MVKCADCGFLALRLKEEWRFVDADNEFRTLGSPRRSLVEHYPVCFARAFDLSAELREDGATEGTTAYNVAVVTILANERSCDDFTEWHQGFTPKEHREMLESASNRRWRVIETAIFILSGVATALLAALITRGG